MKRDKELHHESIIEAATAEFLEYGFTDASMRRIASAAGMSASGLYKHFAGKEEMFAALVEPAYQGLMDLFRREADDQRRSVGNGDLSQWETGRDAKLAMAYIYDHLDAFRLLVCKSQGTKYEGFLHELAVLEEETTLSFMEMLKQQGMKDLVLDLQENGGGYLQAAVNIADELLARDELIVYTEGRRVPRQEYHAHGHGMP